LVEKGGGEGWDLWETEESFVHQKTGNCLRSGKGRERRQSSSWNNMLKCIAKYDDSQETDRQAVGADHSCANLYLTDAN
jgi:hypothetical protein